MKIDVEGVKGKGLDGLELCLINRVEKGKEMCGGIPDEAGNEMRNERDYRLEGSKI